MTEQGPCRACGARLGEAGQFCTSCGAEREAPQSQQVPTDHTVPIRLASSDPGRRADRLKLLSIGAVVLVVAGVVLTALLLTRHGGSSSQPPSSPAAGPTSSTSLDTPTSIPPPSEPSASPQVSTTPAVIGVVTIKSDSTVAHDVASTLDTYFSGINNRDFSSTWAELSTAEQGQLGGFDQFAQQLSTSTDSDVVLHSALDNGNGTASADVSFTSMQSGDLGPNPGETCTQWDLTYNLVSSTDGYLIDGVPSGDHSPCA